MNIAIGNDHRGVESKQSLQATLESWGYQVSNCGADTSESCDYPDIAGAVAGKVASGECDRGILICGTGIGMAIAANKVCGARAAVCNDLKSARLCREHNNANVLCLSGDLLAEQSLDDVIKTFLETEFEGGRHARRVDKIAALESCKTALPEGT